MELKITTLIENKIGENKNLNIEHGLSMHIQVDGMNILFDTGESGKFIENAEALGIDLNKLDYVLLSHGHYDHTGGFKRLMEEFSPKFKLIVGDTFFNKKYKILDTGEYKFIGNSFDQLYLEEKEVSVEYMVQDKKHLSENVIIFTDFNKKPEYENFNDTLFVKKDEKYILDDFPDEISLSVKTEKGLIVIVGCSHVGVVNILETIKERTGINIYGVIGGTHLVSADKEKLGKVISYLKQENIKLIGTSHCTGEKGEIILKECFSDEFFNNNTGNILIIS